MKNSTTSDLLSGPRWCALLGSLGLSPEKDTFDALCRAYAEPHRKYHTERHLAECLMIFDRLKSLSSIPAEVELALWFHDAVYDPKSNANEERSADWATDFLTRSGADPLAVSRVRGHILATRHIDKNLERDAALVVDIDLSILGSSLRQYEDFEQAVREEYRWVPEVVYCQKRSEILSSFLQRSRLYSTPCLFSSLERTARDNLARTLQRLAPLSR